MRMLTRWSYLALFAMLTIAFAGSAVVGEGSDRLVGGAGALMFGGGGLAWALATRRPPAPAIPFAESTVVGPDGPRPGWVTPLRPSRQIAVAFGGVSMGVASALLAAQDGPGLRRWLLAFGAGFFLLAAFVGFWRTVRGAVLALTPDGLRHGFSAQATWVPWDAIAEAGVFEISHNTAVGFVLYPGQEVRLPLLARLNRPFQRMLTGYDVAVLIDQAAAPPEIVVAAVRYYLDHSHERGQIGQGPAPVQRWLDALDAQQDDSSTGR